MTKTDAHDLTTYKGWMAAARALLAGKDDWTALVEGDDGFVVMHNGEIFAMANEGAGYVYSEEDLYDFDNSAWSAAGCWDGMTPEACAALLTSPTFVEITHS